MQLLYTYNFSYTILTSANFNCNKFQFQRQQHLHKYFIIQVNMEKSIYMENIEKIETAMYDLDNPYIIEQEKYIEEKEK